MQYPNANGKMARFFGVGLDKLRAGRGTFALGLPLVLLLPVIAVSDPSHMA